MPGDAESALIGLAVVVALVSLAIIAVGVGSVLGLIP